MLTRRTSRPSGSVTRESQGMLSPFQRAARGCCAGTVATGAAVGGACRMARSAWRSAACRRANWVRGPSATAPPEAMRRSSPRGMGASPSSSPPMAGTARIGSGRPLAPDRTWAVRATSSSADTCSETSTSAGVICASAARASATEATTRTSAVTQVCTNLVSAPAWTGSGSSASTRGGSTIGGADAQVGCQPAPAPQARRFARLSRERRARRDSAAEADKGSPCPWTPPPGPGAATARHLRVCERARRRLP